jgi:hypothetical protein
MKTATELFHEYYAKPPKDRINTTIQDYVYDYMLDQINEIKETNRAMVECMDDAIRLINEGNTWDAIEVLK